MEGKQLSNLYDLFYNVMRLHHQRANMLFEKLGIYPTHHLTLLFINQHNGCSQKEVSEIIKTKPASITVMLQKMEKWELIERRNDKNDQRITRVYITEKGKQDLIVGMQVMENLNKDCFGFLSEDDQKNFYHILNLIYDNLKTVMVEPNQNTHRGDEINAEIN